MGSAGSVNKNTAQTGSSMDEKKSPAISIGSFRNIENNTHHSSKKNSPIRTNPRSDIDLQSDIHIRSSQNEYRLTDGPREENVVESSPRSEVSNGVTELFAHTAMSLGMDNDDLLFNLLYFGDGNSSNFGTVLNSAQQETIALHSENNTPYKLKPASEATIAGLMVEDFCVSGNDMTETECAVCKDEMESGCEILRIPVCKHYFHKECLLRWIQLQGWCPVCRARIDEDCGHTNSNADSFYHKFSSPTSSMPTASAAPVASVYQPPIEEGEVEDDPPEGEEEDYRLHSRLLLMKLREEEKENRERDVERDRIDDLAVSEEGHGRPVPWRCEARD